MLSNNAVPVVMSGLTTGFARSADLADRPALHSLVRQLSIRGLAAQTAQPSWLGSPCGEACAALLTCLT